MLQLDNTIGSYDFEPHPRRLRKHRIAAKLEIDQTGLDR